MPDPGPTQVMIVEDDVLLATDLADNMREAGHRVVGPFFSLDAAAEALATHKPDIVVLDIDLRGQRSFPIADTLACANVPFVWLSGSSPDIVPARHRGRPFASKPAAPAALLQLIARVLERP
jgi:DNA-binding response OmpR family regulator